MIDENMQYAVLKILQECPEARCSDDILVKEFSRRHCKAVVDLQSLGISFAVLKTLERCRRKVQELSPELKPGEVVVTYRKEMEVRYRNTFVGGGLFYE